MTISIIGRVHSHASAFVYKVADNGDPTRKTFGGQGTSIEHYLLFSLSIGLQIIKVFTIQNEIINTY